MQTMLQNLESEPSSLRTGHRVLLADSDPIYLRSLRSSLAGDFFIISEATTFEECLAVAPKAEILLMGFSLTCGRNALGLLPDLRLRQKRLAVIVILSPTSGWMAPRLHAAGALGVISRRTAPEEIPGLVRDAIHRRPLPPVLADPLREPSNAGSLDLSLLSARELEIFRLIGLAKSSEEIAALLGISAKALSAHRENIKAKLDLHGSGVLRLVAVSHAAWEASVTDHVI